MRLTIKMYSRYTSHSTKISDSGEVRVERVEQSIMPAPLEGKRLGVMLVGLGGNNGTTFAAGMIAHREGLTWEDKEGKHKVEFLGSISQMGSVHIGYDCKGKAHSRLFKHITPMYSPEELVVGGWDICGDDLYTAATKAKVIDFDLLRRLEPMLSTIVPLPSIFSPSFIASNQGARVDNTVRAPSLRLKIEQIKSDIVTFKIKHNLAKVIILWTASTERFHLGNWKDAQELLGAVKNDDPEVPPSILFAIAAIETDCIFLNGSPQNTIVPSVIDMARQAGTFVGGEDFKTGQTKLKSALVDWLVSSGIKPLSIVSYNHLGNNDGKNLSEDPQFRSKEITKKNVIDDVVEGNPVLFPEGKPDHTVVIKYVPAVGDSKRALDEYYSKLFLNGRHTLSLHNTCEDSLLAVPLMLDIVLFAELFSRVKVRATYDDDDDRAPSTHSLDTVLSPLSFFFKAPVVNKGEPTINAFFRQRYGLENFFRVLAHLPPLDHIMLPLR
jgi:myo-inositol-1-phosphate synthase